MILIRSIARMIKTKRLYNNKKDFQQGKTTFGIDCFFQATNTGIRYTDTRNHTKYKMVKLVTIKTCWTTNNVGHDLVNVYEV